MTEPSRRGRPPTSLERECVERANVDAHDGPTSTWLRIAKRYGLEPVLAVLDEWGGEKLRVITRENFLREILRPLLYATIVERSKAGDDVPKIARELHVSRRTVYRVLRRSGGRRAPARHGMESE